MLIFCVINEIAISSKKEKQRWKRERTYRICLGIYIVGAIIILGAKYAKSDFMIVVGSIIMLAVCICIWKLLCTNNGFNNVAKNIHSSEKK